jgi:DNA-binding MarR family transcriptional regulator
MSGATAMVSSIEAHLGYWLRFVSNHVSNAFSRKLAACDVTVAEWVTLRELYEHEEIAPSQLAARLGMTRGAISKLADRLLAKELVAKAESDVDRRFQSLRLTRAGRALVPKLSALADQNDDEFFGQLSAGERKAIERVMRRLVVQHALKSVPVE